jgi:hypothetical protein
MRLQRGTNEEMKGLERKQPLEERIQQRVFGNRSDATFFAQFSDDSCIYPVYHDKTSRFAYVQRMWIDAVITHTTINERLLSMRIVKIEYNTVHHDTANIIGSSRFRSNQ